MIFDKIKSFSYSPNKDKQFGIKSGIVFANSKTGNYSYPLLYISKPKCISEEDYQWLLDHIDINFYHRKEQQ